MTDIEKIKQAETYISTIEKDFDPVNGGFLNPDDLLTNERMKKCLGFTKMFLRELIAKNGLINPVPRYLTYEQYAQLTASEQTGDIKYLVDKISGFCVENDCRAFSYNHLLKFLVSAGMLNDDKYCTITDEGFNLGISYHDEDNLYKKHFTPEAQQFIIDNLDSVLEYSNINF